jgi:hypothetical protein
LLGFVAVALSKCWSFLGVMCGEGGMECKVRALLGMEPFLLEELMGVVGSLLLLELSFFSFFAYCSCFGFKLYRHYN